MASPSPSSSSEAGESEINLPAAAVAASKRDDTLKPGEFPHPEVVTFPPQEQNGDAISVAAAILPGSDASKGDETLKPGEFPHPEVVAFPQQEQNGDAVAAAILLHSNASKLAKEIQGKLARGTVGCKICHSVVRRSAPVDASQGKCLDSPYWRCPGCGLVYAAPPTLACLLEDDKMRNSVPELRGAGGLSLRSPLPEDTATTRRYSAAAAASPTVSASKLADDDGLPPSAAAPHLNLVPENGLASQHEDMDAASNPSTHPVPVPVPVVGDSAYAPISNAVEAGGLSPRSNRLVAALAYLERADASTGSSRPRTPPPRERADASTGSSRPRTPPPRERADASTGSSRPRTPPPRPRPRPIQEPVSHVFVCYGRMDTWPCTGPLVPEETVPRLLSLALRRRQLNHQITISLFDPGDSSDFVEGDVMVFPLMKCYSLNLGEIDGFVDTVLMGGELTWHGEQKALVGSFGFVCCHDHGYQLRECSICGPATLSLLTAELQIQGLGGRLQCYGCTPLAETPGEIIFFLADDEDLTCQCVLYSRVFPGWLRPMLSSLFGDGTLGVTTGTDFFRFWVHLRMLLLVGAQARTWIFMVPFRMDSLPVGTVREEMVRTFCIRLCNIALSLREAAIACQAGEVSFDWMDAARRELNLVVKSLYRSARFVRKMVKARATLSVVAPTLIHSEVLNGVAHINVLVSEGENLSNFVVAELDGKPFPQGRELFEPICGINIM